MLLEGKVAIVTGAGQGIGQAIALGLAKEGARVALAARNEANLRATAKKVEALRGQSLVVPTDLHYEDQVRRMVGRVVERWGRVDILVNNSGVAGPTKSLEDVSAEEWDDTLAVNLRGAFFCCKYVVPRMKEQRWGRIINISSVSGKRPLPQRTPYTSSKMALIGLTRTLAFELGEYGITVNAVCPGATEGPRIQAVIERMASFAGTTFEEAKCSFTDPAALKRLVTPEDTAGLCVFLCSEAGRHMTAQDINVTAGLIWY
ncbi:MAG: SDR family NAD(P)-dependent oxidoreductase [Nitrospinota bacterium]